MSLNLQRALAGIVSDSKLVDSEVERGLASSAEIETVRGKSLNEALRFARRRKPCGPDLNRLPARISSASASPQVHQQIAEPPRSTATRQSYAKKPDFVTAPHRDQRIDFVQGLHSLKFYFLAYARCVVVFEPGFYITLMCEPRQGPAPRRGRRNRLPRPMQFVLKAQF